MLKITNKNKSPIQLVVRSRKAPRAFTTLNIPGVGNKKNVYYLEDERHTEYVDRVKNANLISIERVPDDFNK